VFFEQQLDAEAAQLANFPSRDRERFMTHWTTKVLGDPTVLVQTVTVDGEVAGSIVAWWDADRRFVGYWLGRPFWGRGVGTRALRLFLEREQTRPLYADPFSGNPASIRILEKCGFERSGTVRYGHAEHIMLILT
jgi:RimJ/RimL family protein N-acetyltransferase